MATKSGVRQSMRRQVLRDCGYRCAFCGLQGYEKRNKSRRGHVSFAYPTSIDSVWLSIDHIVPRSRGGTAARSNLRVLCTLCNGLRGAPWRTSVDEQSVEEHW